MQHTQIELRTFNVKNESLFNPFLKGTQNSIIDTIIEAADIAKVIYDRADKIDPFPAISMAISYVPEIWLQPL